MSLKNSAPPADVSAMVDDEDTVKVQLGNDYTPAASPNWVVAMFMAFWALAKDES